MYIRDHDGSQGLITILLKTLQLFCKNLSLALEAMLAAKSNTGSKNINEPLVQP